MNYEREFNVYLRQFKILQGRYYFINKNQIIYYYSLVNNNYHVLVTIEKFTIIDYHVQDNNLFLVMNDYKLNKYFIFYFKLKYEGIFITELDLITNEIFNSNEKINKLIVLNNFELIFNLGNKLIFSKFSLIKLKNNQNNFIEFKRVIEYKNLKTFLFSEIYNDILEVDGKELMENKMKLVKLEMSHRISIMISKYYIYAKDCELHILRNDRNKWSENEKVINIQENYIINSLQSKNNYLYILAINIELLKCRIYIKKIKNLYL